MTGKTVDPEPLKVDEDVRLPVDPDAEVANLTTPHWDRVRKFMADADQELHDTPTLPSQETCLLRARLILEEALETIHALGACVQLRTRSDGWLDVDERNEEVRVEPSIIAPDLEAIADGCADLSVVNVGTLIACGIKDDALLREVDLNNLAKFKHICPKCGKDYSDLGNSSLEVLAAVQPMTTKRHEPGMWKCTECGTEWRSGYRRKDGKWVKPENHPSPDIEPILKVQGSKA